MGKLGNLRKRKITVGTYTYGSLSSSFQPRNIIMQATETQHMDSSDNCTVLHRGIYFRVIAKNNCRKRLDLVNNLVTLPKIKIYCSDAPNSLQKQ